MPHFLKTLSLAALLAAGPAFAQDDATQGADGAGASQGTGSTLVEPSGTGTLNMGTPADGGQAQADPEGPGTSYVGGDFGDWQQRCVRAPEGPDPCQLYQLLRDAEGNAVAEMSVFPLPEGREAEAGSTIVTPLETLLTRNITITVDGGAARRYPFEFCARQGCISRVGFTGEEINQFKRGANGKLVIFPAAAPDQAIELTISLSGFTAGYEAVREANTAE